MGNPETAFWEVSIQSEFGNSIRVVPSARPFGPDLSGGSFGSHLLLPRQGSSFYIDHVFPSAAFHARKLKQLDLSEDEIERLQDNKDRLSNLQLLQGPDNQSKNDQMPAKWIAETYKKEEDRKDYISRYMLDGVMTDLTGFDAFFKGRRGRLLERIEAVLNGPAETAT